MYDYAFYRFYARNDSETYVTDKRKSIDAYKGYMFSRLSKMFHYSNLPRTLPQYMLEYYLMSNGSCLIASVNSNLYAFLGSFGGEPDPYLRPTLYVVANPALKFDKTFHISNNELESDECVLMRNDILWQGLNPLISRYATLLAENTITIRVADIMLRIVALISSPDDKTKAAADIYIKNIIDGKLSSLAENRFFDGVKMQSPPSNNGSYLTQFIELQQYLMGQFYNEIGVQSAFNMKREAINEAETKLSEDTLFPLVESMLQCRQEDVSRLNEIFGTDIEVVFDSVWRQNIIEQALQLKAIETPGADLRQDGDELDAEDSDESSVTNGSAEENAPDDDESEETEEVEQNDDSQLTDAVNKVVEDMIDKVIGKEEDDEPEGNDESKDSSQDSKSADAGIEQ